MYNDILKLESFKDKDWVLCPDERYLSFDLLFYYYGTERYNIGSIFCQWPRIMQAFTFQEWDILRTSCCKEWFSDVTERISDPGMLVAYRACSDYL